jgi:hypothetical protein
MENAKTVRNVAIIGLIALAVFIVPGGGRVASTFGAAVRTAFALGIGYLAVRMYREYRVTLHSLGDRHRALLYGAIAAGVFIVFARGRMWETGLGELAWFVLLGLIVYSLLGVYRHWRAY